jgi:predicted ATPase
MITSIQLRNFKGHRDTIVQLGQLTVLVGPNGSGKTSVLQALGLMAQLMDNPPGNVLCGHLDPRDLIRRESTVPMTISLQGRASAHYLRISVEWPVAHQGDDEATLQQIFEGIYGEELRPPRPLTNPIRNIWGWNDPIVQAIGPAMLYHFDAREIAATAYSPEENPKVEKDGSNTAVVLATLKLENEEVFEQIETELRKIVPSIQRIRVKRVKMPRRPDAPSEDRIGHKVFLDFKNAPDIPAHAASEGTLITLALLTALCSPNRPRLLLLDDIDQSLHPQAQMELMRELKRLLENFPEVQLVATTHSPYILDELAPEDVRVFALRPDGSVACRSLSEHPQAEKMRGALTTGQLWSLDPEWRWVLGEG